MCLIGVQVFRPRTPSEAIALCSRLLEYTPTARLTPLEACAHSFFDELRDPNVKLPNGREKPSLFNFTTQGILAQVSLKTERVNICSDAHELVFSYCEMLAHTPFKLFFKSKYNGIKQMAEDFILYHVINTGLKVLRQRFLIWSSFKFISYLMI